MNRDDIIRMAREAGFSQPWTAPKEIQKRLERFAALIIQHKALDQLTAVGQYEEGFEDGAKAEREECAKFIENEYVRQFEEPWRQNLAKAIRARGQQ